jgi:uncharacterized membrane protein
MASTGEINVGTQERMLSAGAGLLLALYGAKRMRLGSLLLAGAGVMLLKRAVSGHCDLYEMLGRSSAGDGAAPEAYFERGVHVDERFTINRPAAELYAYWRELKNLPTFMRHLESVTPLDDKRSQWVARGPLGVSVKWDAEIINDQEGKVIAWRSLGGAEVDNAGSVRFEEADGGGTEVSVTIEYIPPAGQVGSWLAKLFGGDAAQLVREDVRRFKEIMEMGARARS